MMAVQGLCALCCQLSSVCLPCRLAYDGKGNFMVKEESQLSEAIEALGGYDAGLYAEAWVPYVKVCI